MNGSANPVFRLRKTQDTPIAEDPPPAPTVDLDADLDTAIEDFASEVSEVTEASDLGEISSDAPILEDEPAVAVLAEVGSAVASERPQEAEILKVELAPLEAGGDFDDVFVELIDE